MDLFEAWIESQGSKEGIRSRRHPRFDVSEIKRQICPYNFYLKEQGLDRFGLSSGRWATAGLCPFHEDRSTGSFKINKDFGAYTCFSCGAKGGDIIDFLQKKHRSHS